VEGEDEGEDEGGDEGGEEERFSLEERRLQLLGSDGNARLKASEEREIFFMPLSSSEV